MVELLVHYHAYMILTKRLCHQKTWVSIVQPSGHITICVDPQSYKPISGSINNLRTSKFMPRIQMKDTLTRFFNLGAQLRF
jgi:hypothetical protein